MNRLLFISIVTVMSLGLIPNITAMFDPLEKRRNVLAMFNPLEERPHVWGSGAFIESRQERKMRKKRVALYNLLSNVARSGKTHELKNLLDTYANIIEIDIAASTTGYTLLHEAVKSGNVDTVKLLLERGADLNSKDKSGKIPLYHALEAGNTDMVKLLFNKDTDIDDLLVTAISNNNDKIINNLILDLDKKNMWQDFANQHPDSIESARARYQKLARQWTDAYVDALRATRAMTQDQSPIPDIAAQIADQVVPDFDRNVASLLGLQRGKKQKPVAVPSLRRLPSIRELEESARKNAAVSPLLINEHD